MVLGSSYTFRRQLVGIEALDKAEKSGQPFRCGHAWRRWRIWRRSKPNYSPDRWKMAKRLLIGRIFAKKASNQQNLENYVVDRKMFSEKNTIKRGYLDLRWELDDGGAEVQKFNPFPHLLPSKFPGAETEAEEGELSGDSEEVPPVLHRWHRHPVASATVLVLPKTQCFAVLQWAGRR